ncbi:MAG: 16S rRNA (guanine(527)-N(7))-methyltransferase RsmG [Anaerolineae bacterium]|nr:16S rRNA (guanine(527)-N(7))-methyltransferase RsmG [Anaerolineae bacterium]
MDVDTLLTAGAAHFGLALSEAQLHAFALYYRELVAWNEKINLTRIIEPDEVVSKHFLDSLSVVAALPKGNKPLSLIDVGSGAGFPGIPLRIALPDIRVTLLESTGKKTKFLQHVIDTLALKSTRVITARAEEAGQHPDHRAKYDVAVARAVSRLPVLIEYMLPLVKVGGQIIAQKGQNPAEEIEAARSALRVLGGQLIKVEPIAVPSLDGERHLVIVKKIKPTPKLYPRRPGLPNKEPL